MQSSDTILKEVDGKIIWNKNINEDLFFLATGSLLRRVYAEVTFIIWAVDLYKWKKNWS
jgi:hypothetical protein